MILKDDIAVVPLYRGALVWAIRVYSMRREGFAEVRKLTNEALSIGPDFTLAKALGAYIRSISVSQCSHEPDDIRVAVRMAREVLAEARLPDPVRLRRRRAGRGQGLHALAVRDPGQPRRTHRGSGRRHRRWPDVPERPATRADDPGACRPAPIPGAGRRLRRGRVPRHLVLGRRRRLRLETRVHGPDAAPQHRPEDRPGPAAGDHDPDRLTTRLSTSLRPTGLRAGRERSARSRASSRPAPPSRDSSRSARSCWQARRPRRQGTGSG
jgi:hypothetical protein